MIDSEIQQVEKYYNLIMEYLVTYSMQILGAILILFIGLWIAQKVSNMVAGLMQRHNIDIDRKSVV